MRFAPTTIDEPSSAAAATPSRSGSPFRCLGRFDRTRGSSIYAIVTPPVLANELQRSIDSLADAPVPSADEPRPPLDLSIAHRLHVVGVGGPGMSAVAIALAEMGHVVSGSDLREHPVLERVRAAGVEVHIGHDRSLVHGVDAVTASTAIPERNIELDEARTTGVTVLSRAGMLASICARARSLAVAGTHGKTTTTSMLMLILAEAGLRPSFVVGGDVTDVGTGAQWTHGDWMVVEADESDGTHLELPLHGTILTNVESDHLDHYGSFDGIVAAFDELPRPDRRAEGHLRRRPDRRSARRPSRWTHLRTESGVRGSCGRRPR